jgi:hypothetical protein
MKTKRQKHKAAKARSIAARAAKKLEMEASSESETNSVAQAAEPPKKKPKLERLSSPGKLVKQHPLPKQKPDDRSDGNRLGRQPKESPKESQATDAKTSTKSGPVGGRKKRKEVTNRFTHPPLQQDTNSLSVEVLTTPASMHWFTCSGRRLRLLFRLRSTTLTHCPTVLLLLLIGLPPDEWAMTTMFSSVSLYDRRI